MTLDETLELLAQVALVDDRVVKVDEIEQRAQVTVWAAVLRDVPLQFAGQAVGEHYAASAYPIMPKDIAGRWRAQVRDRLGRATGTFEPTRHPALDPDDIGGFVQALRTDRGAVAGGEQPDTEPVAFGELMPALGDRFGIRLAETVPANGEFRTAKETQYPAHDKPAGPAELAVHCPACGAGSGSACKTTHRGRRMKGTHPSRADALTAAAARAEAGERS